MFSNKATDTGEDIVKAKDAWNGQEKQRQVAQIESDITENLEFINKCLRDGDQFQTLKYSGVTEKLHDLQKQLKKYKFSSETFMANSNFTDSIEEPDIERLKNLQDKEFKEIQTETAKRVCKFYNEVMKNQLSKRQEEHPQKKLVKVKAAQQDLHIMKERISYLEKVLETSESALEERLAEIQALQAQSLEKERHVEKLVQEIGLKQDQIQTIEREKHKMESVQNEIKNQNYELQQMNEQNKSKLLATQTKLKDLEQENQKLKDEIMAVKRLIESRNVSKAEKKKIKEIVQSIQTSQLTSEEHSEALNKIL